MLKLATTRLETGRQVIIIGLSLQEMVQLCRENPKHAFVIDGAELGAPVDIVIFQGETEATMLDAVDGIITIDTKITVDDKLKN